MTPSNNSRAPDGSAEHPTTASGHRRRSCEVPCPTLSFGPILPPSQHPNCLHELDVAICTSSRGNFFNAPLTIGQFANLASHHDERDSKDGAAAIFAKIHGYRNDDNVRHVSALTFEIDGKLSKDDVVGRVTSSGLEALLWTTHNHCRETQWIGLETYRKWHRQTFGVDGTPTDDGVNRFCAGHDRFKHLGSVRLLDNGRIRVVREFGRRVEVFAIAHDPEHKVRIVFPLLTPIRLNGPDTLTIAEFKAIYHLHGRQVFGDAYSKESQNPARLHYMPSHRPGTTGETILFPGSLLDPDAIWQMVLLKRANEEQTSSDLKRCPSSSERDISRRSGPSSLHELEYVLRYIAPDLDYPDWFRCIAVIYHETGGSAEGAELAHSWSSGDARYDFSQVERIWDSLTIDHHKPVGMGSLVRFARKNTDYRPYQSMQSTLDFILS